MSKIEEEELNKIMSASVTTAADVIKACDTMAAFINGVIELPPRTIKMINEKDKRTMEEKQKKAVNYIQEAVFVLEEMESEETNEEKKEELKSYIDKLYNIFGSIDIMEF